MPTTYGEGGKVIEHEGSTPPAAEPAKEPAPATPAVKEAKQAQRTREAKTPKAATARKRILGKHRK